MGPVSRLNVPFSVFTISRFLDTSVFLIHPFFFLKHSSSLQLGASKRERVREMFGNFVTVSLKT